MLEKWWGAGTGCVPLAIKSEPEFGFVWNTGRFICRRMSSHTVSVTAWEDDRHPSRRGVFEAWSLNLCYCWQESWDENISTKTVRTINKIPVFCNFTHFDWMSVCFFSVHFICVHLIFSPNFSRIFSTWLTPADERRATLLTEYEWAPNALHLQKLIMHFMILIICNEKNRRKDEKGGNRFCLLSWNPFQI